MPTEGVLPQRILVVGAGFIGSAIARNALGRGIAVRLLTRRAGPGIAVLGPLTEMVIADATDSEAMALAVRGVDHVYYTVGDLRTGIGDAGIGGNISRALPPLLSTLEACAAVPNLRFTFLSSGGTVYGEPVALPIGEDHGTDPLVAYGIMKLACEKYVGMYAQLHGLDARIARCANAYGEGQPGDRPQGVVAAFLHRLARQEPVTLFGDGSITRDFLEVNDLARALIALHAAPPTPRIVNIGTGVGTSLRELVDLIEEVTGRRLAVDWQPARDFDVSANVLDVSRLRSLVEFEPVSLAVGVRITWQQCLDSLRSETAGASQSL